MTDENLYLKSYCADQNKTANQMKYNKTSELRKASSSFKKCSFWILFK